MNTSRGSMWKKCDFHVHTPLSSLSNNFGSDFDEYVKKLFKSAIEKKVHVVGITDYFTIEGYKKIKQEYVDNLQKLQELFTAEEIDKIKAITLFANVEFRLDHIINITKHYEGGKTKVESARINFHVIFSDELPIKTIEESFLHDLDFVYESEPFEKDKKKKLKVNNLHALGKRLKSEQPDLLGNELQVGMTHAVVNDGQIIDILSGNADFRDKYLIVVPADEDLSEVKWNAQGMLTRKQILSKANAFFSSNANTIAFGLGKKAANPEEFVAEFKSLKPCLWGSDAHEYEKLFEPDRQNYCWIKAAPTFEGLRQILFEPEDRVFIGPFPKLYTRISESRGNYLDKLTISQAVGYDGRKGVWFKDFEVPLGLELTAIIGNKGKGKSAIADIIGMLGNSHINKKDFSFLNGDKFCQKGYGENFIGKLTWFDKTESSKRLNEDIDVSSVERVKYIPQSYLEKLCNDEDGNFKEEINKVVFSRLDDSDKLGKKTFAELETYKTDLLAKQIDQLNAKIASINRQLDILERKALPEYRQGIENKKQGKEEELRLHDQEKKEITTVPNPESNSSLSSDQKAKAENASALGKSIAELEEALDREQQNLAGLKIQASDLGNISGELDSVKIFVDTWKNEQQEILTSYGLSADKLISLTIDKSEVNKKLGEIQLKIASSNELLSLIHSPDSANEKSIVIRLAVLKQKMSVVEKELEKPFKDYQEYLGKIKEWEAKQKSIVGSEVIPESIKYFEAELTYIEKELPREISTQKNSRLQLVKEVYNQKKQIQDIYNKMKEAISGILEQYSGEQNITIESSFRIDKTFFTQFFDYVFRYGDFFNNDEALRKMIAKYNFDEVSSVENLLNELEAMNIRFKEGRKADFYNFICSLSYLRSEYDLRLNRKRLTQLSPGEKGGLLLVFYLVLDKDNRPLIIDQPEDNLDNQSVAEILVPYIKRAKKLRQIIMVTHNPNLAIVADAEQIIYMNIDKENTYTVFCDTGGIEDKVMNNHIVNILEGKMKAFDTRRVKYKKYVA